jgi:predicted GNAT superfamily acetyltransferase
MGKIEIRDFNAFSEYRDCVDVQREVWAFPDVDLVPAAHLVAMHHHGGACIGAFDENKMVGFVCGLVGWENGEPFHHSHMLAVLPAYRGRHLGEALKWAQRDHVLAQKLKLITWTFDPLQSLNAMLNFNKLAAVVRKYRVNVYGESGSKLWGGLPTDRFEVEWWIESSRVVAFKEGRRPERRDWEDLPRANRTRAGEHGFRGCEDELRLDLEDSEILVENPADITSMMAQARELAFDWRMKTRKIFQGYLDRGYAVVGFHSSDGRYFYRLERQSA